MPFKSKKQARAYLRRWQQELNPQKWKAICQRTRKKNAVKIRAANKKWAKEHPKQYREIERRKKLRLRYGPQADVHQAVQLRRQKNLCAICLRRMKKKCLDHCHVTNVLRGVLCDTCNTGLGMFKENPKFLRRAVEYLKKWK